MSDYDIVLKLDPTQPVQGAKAVTAGVAQVEAQGKRAAKAMDDVASAAKSLKSIDFKQAAAAGAQAWGLLNQQLKLTETAVGKVIDSGVKFGQIGAQIAGPWGAAIGAIGGGLFQLGETFGAFHDQINEIEAKLRSQQAYAARGALALLKVNEAFTDQRSVLKQADADLRNYNSTLSSTFRLLGDISNAIPDAIGNLTRRGLGVGWGKNVEFRSGGGAPQKPDWDKISVGQWTADDADAISGGRLGNSVLPNGFGLRGAGNYGVTSADADRVLQQRLDEAKAWERIAVNTREWNLELERSAERTKQLAEFTQPMQNAFADFFATGELNFRRMIDAMIADAARLAALKLFSGSLFGPSLEDGLVRNGAPGIMPLAQASAPYFGGSYATGGTYTAPATGGGPDSIPTMFRMSPRETATFTPHGQAFGGSGRQPAAPPTPVIVNVIDQRDPRALLSSHEFGNAVRQVVLDSSVLLRRG